MKTAGYIVFKGSNPLQLCKENEWKTPRGGVLLFSRYVTLFPTYKRAWLAIQRTLTWSKEQTLFPAKRHEYKISRLNQQEKQVRRLSR